MSSGWSSRIFWADWLGDPAVRELSLSERGLWIDLLALMAQGTPVGYLTDRNGMPLTVFAIAKAVKADKTQVKRTIDCILAKGAASRDADGRVYNRRMVRTQNGLRPGTAGLPQQKGADRVADRGAAARAKSGAKGGAVTKRKWQQLQQNVNFATANLPEQNGGKGATASLSLSKSLPLGESQSDIPVSPELVSLTQKWKQKL